MVIMGATMGRNHRQTRFFCGRRYGMRNRFLLGAGVALAVALSWADAQAQLLVPPSGPGSWYFGGQVGWTMLDSERGSLGRTAGGSITAGGNRKGGCHTRLRAGGE